jgi:hypothetical protein
MGSRFEICGVKVQNHLRQRVWLGLIQDLPQFSLLFFQTGNVGLGWVNQKEQISGGKPLHKNQLFFLLRRKKMKAGGFARARVESGIALPACLQVWRERGAGGQPVSGEEYGLFCIKTFHDESKQMRVSLRVHGNLN